MPISFREYSEGLDVGEKGLLEKLDQQPYQAYSLADLSPKDINPLGNFLNMITLNIQLNKLEQKGLVKSKHMRGITYYVSIKAR